MSDYAWVPSNAREAAMFRPLTQEEVREFADSAWENHRAGDPIRDEIHHPIYCRECRIINRLQESHEQKWSNRWRNDTQDLY